MQSLCGHLNFICKSVIPGRAFTRRLYFSTAKVLKPHHHIRLTKILKADLEMWLTFLSHPSVYCRSFLDMTHTLTAEDVLMYSDASRNPKLGCGAFCQRDWMVQQWDHSFIQEREPSIAYLELFAVLTAVKLWLNRFRNKRIVLFCDNISVVHMINKNTSNCPNCLILIRLLVLESMRLNVRVYAKHVDTKSNRAADLLSRLKISKFWQEYGQFFHRSSTRMKDPEIPFPFLEQNKI